MKLTPLGIEGAWLAESPVWCDNRGLFREWFKLDDVKAATGIDFSVQQANISQSRCGVIRGIHYSIAPQGQAKLVTCVYGSILDVIVDIRPNSPTYMEYETINLKGNEGRSVLIGSGLGHGFLVLEDNTSISYLLSSPFSPEFEFEIQPNDAELNIDWRLELIDSNNVVISEKDASAPTLADRLSEGRLPK
jgi:dTDP-4-dehydrorhamnose 3,5-epimerase